MLLRPYLEKIKQEKSINYEAFVRQLPDKYREQHTAIFVTKRIQLKPKRWKVTCNNNQAFSELWELTEKPQNRTDASLKGNSHRHIVSANLLLVYHQRITGLRPDVVYISNEKVVQTFESKPTLLLVENEENFLQYSYFIHFISYLTDQELSLTNTDVAFGSGKKGTSERLIKWYNQYSQILCAFDYDLGGLTMFKTIHSKLGKKVVFIQPENYDQLHDLFRKMPDPEEKLLKAITLAEKLGFETLKSEFINTRRFMEQEVLLKDFNEHL